MSARRVHATIGERIGGTALLVFLGAVVARGPAAPTPASAVPTLRPAAAATHPAPTAPRRSPVLPRPLPSGGIVLTCADSIDPDVGDYCALWDCGLLDPLDPSVDPEQDCEQRDQ